MNFSNRVIVTLGSNEGNRLDNIQSCINIIHQTIGTVVKVSGLYETPSWGFKSADFYNCAVLVHTIKEVSEVLEAILRAEETLGRIRNSTEGYQARPIDIDIIAYNDDVISQPHLHVPHPRMTERNFVLYPLRDIDPVWQHPVSGIDINILITSSPDSSKCT
jgi:deoxyguanosine kinase